MYYLILPSLHPTALEKVLFTFWFIRNSIIIRIGHNYMIYQYLYVINKAYIKMIK